METHLEMTKYVFMKKSFEIQKETIKIMETKKNFIPQHPSWIVATMSFLASINTNMSKWNKANEKLILNIKVVPRQTSADKLNSSGQSYIVTISSPLIQVNLLARD